MKQVLAIIPARGGSKGVPRKNVLQICGKPMIGWTIEAALMAKHVDRVVVSSDDPEILLIASRFGATAIERPVSISGDLASSEAALEHAVQYLKEKEDYSPDLIVFLQCTSPLTDASDIDGVIETLLKNEVDTALAVRDFHYFLWQVDEQGHVAGVNHDKSIRQMRQERKPQYLETGAVYAMRTAGFLKYRHRFFGKTAMYVMPPERCLEIDEPVDFQIAEMLVRDQQSKRSQKLLPKQIGIIVFDFDGVFTDNRVLVSQDGSEAVFCDRSDGMGLEMLRNAKIPMLILSKECNPVVTARAKKVQLEVAQGINDKAEFLKQFCKEQSIPLESVIYMGNDLNDLACMEMVGCSVAVADAVSDIRNISSIRLTCPGGRGAIRELAELILSPA